MGLVGATTRRGTVAIVGTTFTIAPRGRACERTGTVRSEEVFVCLFFSLCEVSAVILANLFSYYLFYRSSSSKEFLQEWGTGGVKDVPAGGERHRPRDNAAVLWAYTTGPPPVRGPRVGGPLTLFLE